MKRISLLFLLLSLLLLQFEARAQANAGQDKEICILDSLKVTGSGLQSGDTGTYQWKDLSNGIVMSTDSILKMKITSQVKRKFELRVQKVSYNQTTTSFDTFELTVNPLPTFGFIGLPSRCYYDGAIQLTEKRIAVGRAGYDPSVTDSFLHYFHTKNPSWITGGPKGVNPYVYEYNKFILNSQIPSSGARDSICYDYTDPKGCYNKECKAIRLNPNPVVELKDGAFCQQSGNANLSKLVLKPFSKVGGIESFKCLTVPAGSGVNKDSAIKLNTSIVPNFYELEIGTPGQWQKQGTYTFQYGFKDVITGCQSFDSAEVTVIKLPNMKISSFPPTCINHAYLSLDSFLTDSNNNKRLPNTKWSCVEFSGSRNYSIPAIADKLNFSVVSNKFFNPGKGSGLYLLKAEDVSSGCLVSDSAFLSVYGLPVVQIQNPDTVCASANFQLLNVQPAGNVGVWSGPGVSGNMFDASVSPQTLPFHGPYKIKYEYQNPLTKCTNSDSEYIVIRSMPVLKADYGFVRGTAFDVDFSSNSYKFIDTSVHSCLWVFSNGDTSNLFNPGRVHFHDSGEHIVLMYYANERCQNRDSLRFILDYRMTEISSVQIFQSLYPNPLSDNFNIHLKSSANLTLYDVHGKQVFVQYFDAGEHTIDVSSFSKGVYILNIESGNKSQQIKLILE